MSFTTELVFGPWHVGIWTEAPQIEYRTILNASELPDGWPDGPTLILDFIGSGLSLDLLFAEAASDYDSATLALDFLSQGYTTLTLVTSYTTFEPDPVMGGFADIQVWS